MRLFCLCSMLGVVGVFGLGQAQTTTKPLSEEQCQSLMSTQLDPSDPLGMTLTTNTINTVVDCVGMMLEDHVDKPSLVIAKTKMKKCLTDAMTYINKTYKKDDQMAQYQSFSALLRCVPADALLGY